MLSLPLTDDAELRALEPWQAPEFAAHVAAAREHLMEWLPWGTSAASDEGAAQLLQRYADAQARGEGRILGIWVGGKLMGGVLFRVWEQSRGMCELGVWLAPEAVGRGLVTRASRVMIEWAFRERGIHRVEWRCATGNARSSAVARRLGMTREGVLREAFPLHGVRHDVELWAILASEWPTRR
ncbi:GNAT family N-acetyltransferase [Actinophytocola algeriensis]|uniref:RimJ/RimL family protein N-acetyltransferase n=1 Tax=Actinophytocola algeriensis TaxID=1768010 RepID=A0A7W7VDQ9_9PSEU|nr:GNAT family protein [Actinophytocola algeriensis]MBB4906344.1 RimJ/RimL family protein N-acetyltransferase [Actinophytocola algeriensis]MBE1477825.1 RimJ/RimL family protein N-acetyltransferase [Actinophytocola algeriensis]